MITFLIDDPKMVVKKQKLKWVNSKLVVDEKNSSEDGLEAKFCRFFTENYDEIGEYISDFARL